MVLTMYYAVLGFWPCGLLGVDVVSRVKTRRFVLSKGGDGLIQERWG